MTAETLAEIHLANVGRSEEDQDLSIYSSDVVTRFPFAPEGHTSVLDSLNGLSRFMAAIPGFVRDREVKDVSVTPLPDGAMLRYTESSVFNATGRAYSSPIVWLIRTEGGVITHLEEMYDSLAVVRALGDID
jgi:ketosteroid isomerase-like protein